MRGDSGLIPNELGSDWPVGLRSFCIAENNVEAMTLQPRLALQARKPVPAFTSRVGADRRAIGGGWTFI